MPGSGRGDGFPAWLSGVLAGDGLADPLDGLPVPLVELPSEGEDPGVVVGWAAGESWGLVRGLVDGRPGVEGIRSGLAGMVRAAGAALSPPEGWPVTGLVEGRGWLVGVSGEKRPDGAPPIIDPDRER